MKVTELLVAEQGLAAEGRALRCGLHIISYEIAVVTAIDSLPQRAADLQRDKQHRCIF